MNFFEYYSRFRKTSMTIVDGAEVVGTWKMPTYLVERPDSSLIFKYYVSTAVEGRPDLIANAIYGTPLLDWVIMAFNNPNDILNWPMAGETIEYPHQDLVMSQL